MSNVKRASASGSLPIASSFLVRGLGVAAFGLVAGCSQDVTRLDFLGAWPDKKTATYAPFSGPGAGTGKEIKETSLPPVRKMAADEAPPSGPPRFVKTADYGSKSTHPPSPWPWANGSPKWSSKPLWTDEEPFPWPDPPKEKVPQPKSSFQGHYTTRRGDTLAGIAQRYKVSVSELKRVNGITDDSQVKTGTVLAIPARGTDTPTSPPRVVQVKPLTAPAPKLASVAPPPGSKADARGGLGGATKESAPEPKHGAKAESKEPTAGLRFRWPVAGGRMLSTFGAQPDGTKNEGIKLAVPLGTDIHAVEGGRVHYAGDGLKGYGNLILIRHPNGWVSTYAHASKMLVKVGDDVKRGQVIAKSGKTGPVDEPQLGFELRKGSVPVNPIEYLPK